MEASAGEHLRWDGGARLVHVRLKDSRGVSAARREELAERIRVWTAGLPAYDVLVDACGGGRSDAAWREFWGRFFGAARVRIACYRVAPGEAIVAPLFSATFGVDMRVFVTEAQARAWLGHA